MSNRSKKIKEQEFLAAEQREQTFTNALRFSRQRFKRFDEVILRLYKQEDLSAYFSDRRVAKINECFSKVSPIRRSEQRAFMKNAFVHLHRYSVLFSAEEYIQPVYNMLEFRSCWRKNIFNWKASTNRAADQVNELITHLFCQYPVPPFLYKAFYENGNKLFINWFIHIATGKRVKDLINMPIPFTQKMGHYFLQAPSKLTITEALRWAQVKGLGGEDKLAQRIAYSWIGTKAFEEENFWESFIRTVINGGMFNHDHLTQLIDFIRESKRENQNYTLKGRTLQSLLRQSDEWHERKVLVQENRLWSLSGLYGYTVEKKLEIVKMEELTGSKLLVAEGKEMKHCVATYAHLCETGKTAIFSLRKYSMGLQVETLATIEVNLPLQRIVQAKAKMNRKISEEAKKHVDEWAKKNQLSVSQFL